MEEVVNMLSKKGISFVIIAIVFIGVLCFTITNKQSGKSVENNSSPTENMAVDAIENSRNISKTLEIQKLRGDLQMALGEKSIYPTYYTGFRTSTEIFGCSDEESYAFTEQGVIKQQALCWYANEKHIKVSKEDAMKKIKMYIKYGEGAEEEAEYKEAAKKLGTSFEQIMKNDRYIYRISMIKEELYDQEKEKVESQYNAAMTEEETEELKEKIKTHWDEFVVYVVKAYKKTPEYRGLIERMRTCRELTKSNTIDIKKIKAAGL